MARLIGNTIPLKVIEINRHRNRLILSERQAIQERRDAMKERLIGTLKEGEVRKGRVSSICDFGAFVDIGGADGLVHLSELSWSRVRHPSEVLRVGEEVEVYVLGINEDERKIALSLKRTQAEPWTRVAARYEVGQLVKGTITQLANFGAFARIEDGIEGLIHVSELSDDRVAHPRNIVKEGDEMMLRIIRIDPQRRRMGLSLRRALEFTEQDALEGYVQDNLGAPVKPEELEERNRRNDEMMAERARMEAEEADAEAAEGVDLNDDGPLTATIAEATEAGEEPTASPDPEAVTEALQETEAKAASGDVTVLAHGNVTMDDASDVGSAVSAAGAEEPMPAEAKH
jgi:small subunit ribosomal protein S1